MNRRRWVAVGAVVGIGLALGLTALSRRDAGIDRSGSITIGAGKPIVIDRIPNGYRIEYRVEERVGDDIRLSTDRLSVRRPFDSRLETWTGAPPGRALLSTEIATLGRTGNTRGDADEARSDQPPAVAAVDVRLDVSLESAVKDGFLRRRERREVIGRPCQVYRSGARLHAARLQQPTKDAYVDSCVDRNGLVLEEVRFADGSGRSRRVAVTVALEPDLADTLFHVGEANLTVPNGGGSTRRVVPTSTPPGEFWQLDAPPEGFALVGRYGVVPPQPENFTDPAREGFRQAGVSDVYTRGTDLIVIDQGGTLRAQPPWTVDPTNAAIDLGAIGAGEVVLTPRGAEVRALTGGGHYVRVFGTLAPDALAAIARQLHQVPGGQLDYLD